MGSSHHTALSSSPRRVVHALRPGACALLCAVALPVAAQHPILLADLPEAPQPQVQSQPALPPQQSTSIRGTVLDRDGAMLPDARVTLTEPAPGTFTVQTTTAPDGSFTLTGIPPGPFILTVSNPGFATETTSGIATAREIAQITPITLHPGIATDVEVTLTRTEIAQDQIHDQEKQHVLGFIPNFYVSYVPNPLPLTSRQKAELAWKSTIDPFNIVINAGIAGIEQGTNSLSGYGPGIGGYGKRFAAIYGRNAIGNALGGAVFPILLHQDPRYFYTGTGTTRHRVLRSVAQVFIAKGDNGHWQPDYSGIGGALASSAIANAYLPAGDRDSAGTIFLNTANSFWGAAIGNLCQEFLVRHFTPHLPPTQPTALSNPTTTPPPTPTPKANP